jgi:hypothetical protein
MKEYSVSFEWRYGDMGGRCIRFFGKEEDAAVFADEVNRQLTFPDVIRSEAKVKSCSGRDNE